MDSDSVNMLIIVSAGVALVSLVALAHSLRRSMLIQSLQIDIQKVSDKQRELGIRIDDLLAKLNGQMTALSKQTGIVEKRVGNIEERLAVADAQPGRLFEIEGEESLTTRVLELEERLQNLNASASADTSKAKESNSPQKNDAAKPAERLQGSSAQSSSAPSGPQKIERLPLTTVCAPHRRALRQEFETIAELGISDADTLLEALMPTIEVNELELCFRGGLKAALEELLGTAGGKGLSRDALLKTFKECYAKGLAHPGVMKQFPENSNAELYTVLLIGAQGAGKTSAAHSIALFARDRGLRVLLADCTLKSGSGNSAMRLSQYAARAQIPVLSGSSLSKLHTIAYKAVHRAQDEKFNILVIDTPPVFDAKGRISSDVVKIAASVAREQASPSPNTVLVLDATIAHSMEGDVQRLLEEGGFSGLCLTKLDKCKQTSTAFNVGAKLNIPLWYLCYGATPAEFSLAQPALIAASLFESPGPVAAASQVEQTPSAGRDARP